MSLTLLPGQGSERTECCQECRSVHVTHSLHVEGKGSRAVRIWSLTPSPSLHHFSSFNSVLLAPLVGLGPKPLRVAVSQERESAVYLGSSFYLRKAAPLQQAQLLEIFPGPPGTGYVISRRSVMPWSPKSAVFSQPFNTPDLLNISAACMKTYICLWTQTQ